MIRRALIADDDPPSAELLMYFLESLGFDVAVAGDGNRAIELGTSEDFDLAILDVHLPVYEGGEVLSMLRKRHLLRPIKVIALTGDESPEVRAMLHRFGIDSFLTKPVDLRLLKTEVERLLAQPPAAASPWRSRYSPKSPG